MKQATPFHSQIVFSYWNNQQFIARRWNKLVILNWGTLISQYYPWQFVFLFIALFIMLLHRKVNEFFFFQCYYFKLKCNIKVEQEMAIQHLTVLRKFLLQCYNMLCHCERLDKSSGERLTLYLPYSLWPAYYMYDNVINSHCYRFIMYFSNLILYVY